MKRADGSMANTDMEKAELLQQRFKSVFVTDNFCNPVMDRLVNSNVHLSDVEFTPELVFKSLSTIKCNSACGPDRMSPRLLFMLKQTLSVPLSLGFGALFRESVLPSQWLEAIISPIFKKGLTSDPNNYRPISLTCIACRVMEKIIKDVILKYLFDHKLINRSQHGFLARHSTVSQLLECTNDWTISMASRKVTDCVYVDFKRAFDVVSHQKLLTKLIAYGIDGLLLEWIRSFLMNRLQFVSVNCTFSMPCTVASGVLQGSVLGPLLFLIFINDVCDIATDTVFTKLFADDLKIYTEVAINSGSSDLQACLPRLHEWATKWQMDIAFDKCHTITYGNRRHTDLISYNIGDHLLPHVNVIRDLGVNMDHSLNFSSHCRIICSKANARANLILRCFRTKYVDVLLKAFKVYVRPLVEYASPIWSPRLTCDIDMLERVQRRFTKRLPGLYRLSYEDRLQQLNLDSLESRCIKTDLLLCFKIMRGFIDIDKNDLFIVDCDRVTRGHDLRIRRQHTVINARLFHFSQRVIKHWNNLSHEQVHSASIPAFKRSIESLHVNI